MDFDRRYTKSELLLSQWPDLYPKILEFLSIKGNINEKTIRDTIQNLNSADIDESKL